tara:strand:+ start:5451 stop:5867 length:417 start_codon:yes stop_codon:yes gene_type:complete
MSSLVHQIADHDAPRAIIIDFLQKTILVHPDDGEQEVEFTKESLMYLLSSEPIKMVDPESITSYTDIQTLMPEDEEMQALCLHPNYSELSIEGEVLWTKLVNPQFVLLVTKKLDQEKTTWIVRGGPIPEHLVLSTTSD